MKFSRSIQLVLLLAFAGCMDRTLAARAVDGGHHLIPCGDTVCDPTRGPICVDGNTLRTYTTWCNGESCTYPSNDVDCGALGCCGDHCCTLPATSTNRHGGG
ncbi:MAG: hypothetical protein ACKV2T_21540 [Kofleriaceae bacterium]